MSSATNINESNFLTHFYGFENRQAGLGLVYCSEKKRYYYNVYCIDQERYKELFTVEYEFLNDALESLNSEFGSWSVNPFEKESGCSSCVAKK